MSIIYLRTYSEEGWKYWFTLEWFKKYVKISVTIQKKGEIFHSPKKQELRTIKTGLKKEMKITKYACRNKYSYIID